MTNKSIRDYINLIENAQQEVTEGSTTMWEVSFDYGPHMSKTVKVKASSAKEAKAKVEKVAEKSYTRGIMINWVKPAKQGVSEEHFGVEE